MDRIISELCKQAAFIGLLAFYYFQKPMPTWAFGILATLNFIGHHLAFSDES